MLISSSVALKTFKANFIWSWTLYFHGNTFAQLFANYTI